MTLPLVPGVAGARGRRPLAGALFCVLLLVGCFGSARAQEPTPNPASADPYTATVKVDATAENVVKAREEARLGGQRRALAEIADNLAGGPGNGKLSKLSDNQITDMVISFEVANERMTAVRYTADYTYHFRPADVQSVLHIARPATGPAAGLEAPASTAPPSTAPPLGSGKPVLLLALYQLGSRVVLWDDPNPWRDVWTQHQPGPGGVELTMPLGDVGDVAAIDADKARAGDPDALGRISRKYGTDDILVALAVARGPANGPTGLDISVKRYHAGQLVYAHALSLTANPGESVEAFFLRAVQSTGAAIDSNWKGIAPQSAQQASITVVVEISGLDDWLRLHDQIAGLPMVRGVELRALSRQEATIDIAYTGDVDQLTASLAGDGLNLVRGDPVWHLSRAGAASSN
ncbi:MAG TPA: DUF2066 domain-containing protein [Stellaceae bacterium]|nr:DUF2066 domain-containing protein [Stellaceae bacterium]